MVRFKIYFIGIINEIFDRLEVGDDGEQTMKDKL